MSLPVPDGKNKYNPNSEYAVELDERQVNLLNNIREASLEEFQEISLLLHEIANKGYKNSTSADSMLRKYFIEDANNPKYNQPQSYENGIIGSFYHALKDGRNMIHAFQAMDDPVIKNISKTSPKGKKDHNMNHLNPYTDVNGMIVNSVGKDGIAIVAVGLKGYAAVTDRLNQMKNGDLENLKLNSDLAIQIDNVIGETGAETILIPKGFDLKNMQNVVGKYLDENFSQEMFKSPEDYQDFRDKYLNMLLDEGSSDSLLSVLLTSATDSDNSIGLLTS